MGGSAPGRGVSSVSCKPSQLIPITPGRPGARLAQDCRLLISPLYCHLVINTALLLRATASRGQGRGNDSVLLDVTRCNVSQPLPSTLKQVLVSKLTLADGDPCILSNVSQLHHGEVTTASVIGPQQAATHCLFPASREFVFICIYRNIWILLPENTKQLYSLAHVIISLDRGATRFTLFSNTETLSFTESIGKS